MKWVIVDFLAKFTGFLKQDPLAKELWIICVDGFVNKRNNGARVVIIVPEVQELKYAIELGFKTTNNEVEYEAFIVRLIVAWVLGA